MDSTSFAAKCFSIGKAARRKPPLEAFLTEAEQGTPLIEAGAFFELTKKLLFRKT